MATQVMDEAPAVPAVQEAAARLAPLRRRFDALTAERNAAQGVATGATPNTTAAEQIRARRRLLDIDAEILDAGAEVADAERAHAAAKDAARAAKLAEVNAAIVKVVAKLDAVLTEAARVNAQLLALDEQAHHEAGATLRYSWPELFTDVPGYESRLQVWRRVCRENLAAPAPKG